jgi:putative addiction module component (TIGR02574 family)
MSITAIKEEILSLPASEKAKLIDVLWESLCEPELKVREDAWAAESERRIDAYESGKLQARSAEDVLNDLRKTLRH